MSLGQAFRSQGAASEILQDDCFSRNELLTSMGNIGSDVMRYGSDTITVTVEQVARIDGDPADVDRDVNL